MAEAVRAVVDTGWFASFGVFLFALVPIIVPLIALGYSLRVVHAWFASLGRWMVTNILIVAAAWRRAREMALDWRDAGGNLVSRLGDLLLFQWQALDDEKPLSAPWPEGAWLLLLRAVGRTSVRLSVATARAIVVTAAVVLLFPTPIPAWIQWFVRERQVASSVSPTFDGILT